MSDTIEIKDVKGKPHSYELEVLSESIWRLTRLLTQRTYHVSRLGAVLRCTCADTEFTGPAKRGEVECKHARFVREHYLSRPIPTEEPETMPPPATALAPRENLRRHLETSRQQIALALPRHLRPEKMIREALTLWNLTPALQACKPLSIVACVLRASELGLELSGPLGQAYMVPFGSDAQLLVGYRGLIKLAHNTGLVSYFNAHEVCQGDAFEYEYGSSQHITHKPARGERGPVTDYYAAVRFRDGGEDFEVMSVAQVHAHKEKYSKGWKRTDSPWQTAFDEQAKKTVLRRLIKRVPLSPDLQQLAAEPEPELDPATAAAPRAQACSTLLLPEESAFPRDDSEILAPEAAPANEGPYTDGY